MKFASTLASALLALTAAIHSVDAVAYDRVVAFGDSLTDDGNLLSLLGLPGSPYYQGRFSNGPVAVEVMAAQLGASLTDYAVGGAQTGNGGMLTQIAQYGASLPHGQAVAANAGAGAASTLYFVWGGPNDFYSGSNVFVPTTAGKAADNIKTGITNLYNLGARDFFVPLMPDLGLTPSALKANASVPIYSSTATADSLSFNSLLSANLQTLSNTLSGIHIYSFDTLSYLRQQIQQRGAQGFDVTDACFSGSYKSSAGTVCSNPDQYLFWDGVHPTAIAHTLLGDAFAASLSAVPEPSSWLMLLAGVLALTAVSAQRRRAAARPVAQPAMATAARRA